MLKEADVREVNEFKPTKRKIIFVRHWSTISDALEWKGDDEPLSPKGQKEVHKTAQELKLSWVTKDNSVMLYYRGEIETIVRAKETAEILANEIQWETEKIFHNEPGLKTSNKKIRNKVVRILETGERAARYLDEFLERKILELPKSVQYIIFVVHKSSFSWIRAYIEWSYYLDHAGIGNGETISYDLDNQNRIVRTRGISLDFNSFFEIRSFIKDWEKMDLISFQNHLNALLNKTPLLSRPYLLNPRTPKVLKDACFHACILQNDTEILKEFLKDAKQVPVLSRRTTIDLINGSESNPGIEECALYYLSRLNQEERLGISEGFDKGSVLDQYIRLLQKIDTIPVPSSDRPPYQSISNLNRNAKIADFWSEGYSESDFAEQFENWKFQEFEKIHSTDLSPGDIFRIVFDINSISIFIKVRMIQEACVYGNAFWAIPHPEWGSLVKKISDNSKITIPVCKWGMKEITESFGDLLSKSAIYENNIVHMIRYRSDSKDA